MFNKLQSAFTKPEFWVNQCLYNKYIRLKYCSWSKGLCEPAVNHHHISLRSRGFFFTVLCRNTSPWRKLRSPVFCSVLVVVGLGICVPTRFCALPGWPDGRYFLSGIADTETSFETFFSLFVLLLLLLIGSMAWLKQKWQVCMVVVTCLIWVRCYWVHHICCFFYVVTHCAVWLLITVSGQPF